MFEKVETSKIVLFIIILLTIITLLISVFFMIRFNTYDPLNIIIPSIFTELTAATGCYYWKSKNENRIKLTLGAIKEISQYNGITEEQKQIIEALINTLG